MDFSKRYNREEFVKFLQNDFLPEEDFFAETIEAEIQQETKYIKTVTKLGGKSITPISSVRSPPYLIARCPCGTIQRDIPLHGEQARTKSIGGLCAGGHRCQLSPVAHID